MLAVSCAPHAKEMACKIAEIETVGCEWVKRGSACELAESRKLRVRLAGSDDFGLEVLVPEGVERLRIKSAAHGSCEETLLELLPPRAVHPAVREADAMRRRGEIEPALARMKAELTTFGDADRGRALGMIARIERSAGRTEDAVFSFEEAIAAHRAAGDLSQEARDQLVVVYIYVVHLRRFAEGRAALEAPVFARVHDAELQVIAAQSRARLAIGTGDSRNALFHLQTAEKIALRMNLLDLWRDAKQIEGWTLLSSGRAADAVARFESLVRLTPENEDPCLRGALYANLGWARLISREQSRITALSPGEPLEEARMIWNTTCPEPTRALNAVINLALAAIQEDRWSDAEKYLAELAAAKTAIDPELMLWRLEIEGRVALARGQDREALAIYRKLEELAARTASPSGRWRAAIGRGHAFELAGRTEQAAEAYREGEEVLDRASAMIPLGEGREYFLGGHEESAKSAIALLLRLNRAPEAAELARRARVRPLAALQRAAALEGLDAERRLVWERALTTHRSERDQIEQQAARAWTLPEDRFQRARKELRAREESLERTLETAHALFAPAAKGELRAPAAGELFLVYHPVQHGYAGFAVSSDSVVGRALSGTSTSASPDILSSKLLDPFRTEIERAETIYIMAAGALREVDIHALPFGGAPLLARAPVLYALDFANTSSSAMERKEPTVLFVADPEGNLSAAEQEAKNAAALLKTRGAQVEILVREQASGAAVRELLVRADHFYYAGHARFGGLDGWESALPLAHGGKLTVADILSLPRVPQTAILLGCETARSGRRAAGDSLGLAHAFLTMGAREVVAASRPIDDRAAAEFSAELHRADLSKGLGFAVRNAQLSLAERKPDSDWQTFRVLVR
jgi:tetratricopeptide (TPR) repeat protein